MLLDAAAVFLAPLAVACISSIAVMKNSNLFEPPLSLVDQEDPAAWWETSAQWLGAPEKEITFNSCLSIGMHESGRWRTLRRYGSVQSVTRWDPVLNQPIHTAVGNEYIKVMASAHASLVATHKNGINGEDDNKEGSHLYLGLGAGTLPMLMNSKHGIAIELDPHVAQAAVDYCGLQTPSLQIIVGDALHHSKLALAGKNGQHEKQELQQKHCYSAIFVDIFDASNNVPLAFCQVDFVHNLYDSLQHDGVLIANFHRGSAAENQRLQLGRQAYAQVFGAQNCVSIPCRFQGNVILAAIKDKNSDGKPIQQLQLNVGQAQRLGQQRQWPFDPASRLQKIQLG